MTKSRPKTIKEFGSSKLHNDNVFSKTLNKKIMHDGGRVYFDIQELKRGKVFDGGLYFHIGIRPDNYKERIEELYSSFVKNGIDVHMDLTEEFYLVICRIKSWFEQDKEGFEP